jgi:3-hydroxyacyl-CoA dehydrogenase
MPHNRRIRRVWFLAGQKKNRERMKLFWVALVIAVTSPLAHAEDMAEMISRYRREHGLSTVKTDPQLTAIAERQAKAMAASGIMDHDVAGSFASRMAGVLAGAAAENIAAGSKSWAETLRMWQTSAGHNANLLQSRADSVGVAVARNDQTRYKTFWAMVIAEKTPAPKKKDRKVAEAGSAERSQSSGTFENPISTVKNFICKYLC